MNWLTNRPTWQKVLAAIAGIALILGLVYWLGTRHGREWADSEYLQERDKRTAEIAVLEKSADQHAENERILADENNRLKIQNEAAAEILKANDAKIAGDAQKFVDLQKQRELKGNEIQNASGADSVTGLCADAKRAGFNLSFCR
jgi:hypothetical protein